ncbi:hypothetical protein [Jiangella anatolica]|uniref:hypothetical protein n=1 Tax=Jiangella anatolica TaxID=2670374 RepID=UPI00131412D5|nr:hypothetical protein [Jiangella anatolica]
MTALPSYDPSQDDLVAAIAAVVVDIPAGGTERWDAVILFEVATGERWHLSVSAGVPGVVRGGHPAPTVVVEATPEALREVFLDGRDITHQFAHGGMRLRAGDYYDLIFLSRALGRLKREQGRSR